MSESLFQISCPSCESVFAVTDPELVGQIIACPKCGGMMLVEAAEVAKNEEIAQDSEKTSSAEVGEVAQTAESLPNVETARPKRIDENAPNKQNGENSEDGEDSASDVGETVASLKRSRGGKFVATGVALALVGAAAFWGTRGFKSEPTPVSETGVETENSESGENGENNESGKDEVGGFAPFAVGERGGENEAEPEFLPDGSSSLQNEEDAAFGEAGEDGAFENLGENAQDWNIASNAVDGETFGDGVEKEKNNDFEQNGENERRSKGGEEEQESEDGENSEDGEGGEGGATTVNGEKASSEAEAVVENALSDDGDGAGDLADLSGLGELEGLNEGDALGVEEDEELNALENVDDETTAGEKLAGSNESTGFNEADFERANQNADSESADEPVEVDWSGVASTTSPTLQSALPTLRRERKEIDVDARLALPIKSIEFPSSPVAAIRLLSEFTGVSIVPDLETFVLTRPATSATLDLALRDATAGEALEKVVELLNWEVYKQKDRILIRPAGNNSETLVEERFDVADLTTAKAAAVDETRLEMFETPNNLTPETLAALIKSTVAPETWLENGGNANLTVDGSILAISQNGQNREKIRVLLEGLRAIRGLEPQSDATPEQIIPEKLGWERLTKKTNFAPLTPVALQNAVEILEKSQKIQVFWDDAALIEAGVGRDSTTAARVENGTVDAVLSEILEPLNATYLILGENLILITEKETAKNYRTVEFFSLVGENGERPTLAEARALIEEMKIAVAPETWKTSNARETLNGENASNGESASNDGLAEETEIGENETVAPETAASEDALKSVLSENSEDASTGKDGTVWLDVESSCLIIRQSQPNQRALRRWLTARLAKPTTETNEKAN